MASAKADASVVEDPVLVLVDHEHLVPRGAQPVRGIQIPRAHPEHGMEESEISHAWERAPARSARQGAAQMVWIRIDATTIDPVVTVVKPPTSMGVTSSSKIAFCSRSSRPTDRLISWQST